MRDAPGRGFRRTDRDVRALAETYLAGVMGVRHYVALGIFGEISRARRRLAALEANGHLRRTYFAEGNRAASSVFAIGPAAVEAVAERLGVGRAEVARRSVRPFARTQIEHSLMVCDVRAALRLRDGLRIAFTPEPLARHEYEVFERGRSEPRVFRPDGVFLISVAGSQLAAFVEADRGTVPVRRWRATIEGYARYVSLGLASRVYGRARVAVLAVTPSERRSAELARVTVAVDAPPVFYATLDAVAEAGAFGRCWRRSPRDRAVSLLEIASGAQT